MAAVDGHQDRVVLRDLVWIDETYVNDTDLHLGYGVARKRGLSRQKVRIAVAIDVRKNPVAVVYGRGKPSSARVLTAFNGHIAEGGAGRPRQGEGARRADPRVGLRREGAQGRRQRPGLPGADVHGEQPLLLAQAIPLEVHGHVDVEPPAVPQLVRVPVQGQAGLREMPETAKVVRHLLLAEARFRSST